MYIRLLKKSLLVTALSIFSYGNYAWASGPEDDSTETNTPVRQLSIGLVKNSELSKENSGSFMGKPIPSPVPRSLMENFLSGLAIGGYYRGLFLSRTLTTPYGDAGLTKTMSVGEGQYDPMILMYVGGNPTPATSFGTELIVLNPFTAYQGPTKTFSDVTPYFSMVLRGSINTKHANFFILAGGIEWLRLTPFTFGTNVGFNRYSVFDRRPWDPVGNIKTRYASYYYSGTINQDARFGTRGFKGFIVNTFLPKLNTNVDVFYGKTPNTAGINRENIVRPSGNIGVKIKKNLKNNNYVSLNTFNNYSKSDSINSTYDVQWNIVSTEFSYNLKGVILSGELGTGRYKSPTPIYQEGNWSEGIILDLLLPKKLTKLPISLRYFQIGNNFTSNVANFNNTTISEVNSGYNGANAAVINPFGGGLDNVGDIANNRRGAALNTDLKFWKLVLSAGIQVSSDINRLDQGKTINVGHRVNSIIWGRLPGFFNGTPMAFGPNDRANLVYRGAYEIIKIADTTSKGAAIYKKHYNSLDLQLKYKEKILNRDFFFYYLGTFNSVQNKFSPITVFNNDAYVTAQFHEAEFYYQITRDVIFAFYTGLERIKGNDRTKEDIDPSTAKKNFQSRDLVGQALGFGFDIALSNQTSLFFRQRWFSFRDKNFKSERFDGHEATVELKIFF
jgi:hypothetical protein